MTRPMERAKIANVNFGRRHPERSRLSGEARDLAWSVLAFSASKIDQALTGKMLFCKPGKGTTSVVPLDSTVDAALAAEGRMMRGAF